MFQFVHYDIQITIITKFIGFIIRHFTMLLFNTISFLVFYETSAKRTALQHSFIGMQNGTIVRLQISKQTLIVYN